jgi:hypothetical protein
VRLRTALRRTQERRQPARRFKPVEQVLRAPVRPLRQHVHHQHLSSTTLQLHVAVGVKVASASHPIRLRAVSPAQALGPGAAATTYPGAVYRDQVAPTATVAVAGQPAWPPVPLVRRADPPAFPAQARATPAARALRSAPPPVELVHRRPASPAFEAAANRPAGARVNGTAAPGTRWAGPRWADAGAPAAPGAAPLTAADVPGVVDQVVREIDRRVVAARERRGWTA